MELSLPEEGPAFGASGLGKDGWVPRFAPKAWETPDQTLMSKEFQTVLKRCLSRLPHKVAQVFILREVDEVPSEEICKDLGVSPNNLWVMLHRARMGLRRCLETHWFVNKRKDE
jgi:RNA polymerase sigma-70 factor (ECF subfamily)